MLESQEAFPNSGKSVRIFPVAEMQEQTLAGLGRLMQRTLNHDNIMHVEAIATSGQRRSSRERQATPFFKDQDVWISCLSYKVGGGFWGVSASHVYPRTSMCMTVGGV